MPELPEAERARQAIERAVGREIVAVDDRDTYVCRPHAPGEIAAALVGRSLSSTHRRGKFLWAETGGDGPVLGLHLGMAGRIVVDEPPAPRNWDRFALEFADGGRLALRDKRRLGRALLEPDLAHVGPDAAEVGRDAFRARIGRGTAPLKARLLDQRSIWPASGTSSPTRPCGRRGSPRGARPARWPRPSSTTCAACCARRRARDPRRRRAHRRVHRAPAPRRPLPALRHAAGTGDDRRAHHVLVPGLPAGALGTRRSIQRWTASASKVHGRP